MSGTNTQEICAVVTLNALSFFQFFSTVSVYLKTIQHLAEWQIGLVMHKVASKGM